MRKVSISMLTPEMALAKPLYHKNNLLLKMGTVNLQRYASSLLRLGIYELYITDEASNDIEIPDAITEDTRIKCKVVLFDTFQRLHCDGILDVGGLSDSVEMILEELLQRQDIVISLNEIGTNDDSTLTHSVNATIYSLMLAKQLNYSYANMQRLAMGTLLHDIGKTTLEPKILYKPGHFTNQEFEYVKNHTIWGYELLKKDPMLTELSRIISLQHHERLDGSGYPLGLAGNQIHEFVRISAIADVYDAMTSERCYHRRMQNIDAVNILTRDSVEKLDSSLLALFIQGLALYPNGSLVQLSDKSYGIVKEQNKGLPYRPIIRKVVFENGHTIPIGEVDLKQKLDLTILAASVSRLEQKIF